MRVGVEGLIGMADGREGKVSYGRCTLILLVR